MARYQVILAYDGTNFQGFQKQGRNRTVQGEVETALTSIGWTGHSILYAGRTDTGVHASGQTIAFDLNWQHTPEVLVRALNAKLPDDVAVQDAQVTAETFHPRFDALARRYHYHLFTRALRDPLRERYAWRLWPAPNGELLHEAARRLAGTHDFAAFGSPMKPGGSTIRTVFKAEWITEGEDWSFLITANAFLYRMVRRLVFLQVLVGQQRLSLEEFAAALQTPKPLTPGLAKPNGLMLEKVFYSNDRLEPEGLLKTLSASGEEDCG